jgi:hypothetical protein
MQTTYLTIIGITDDDPLREVIGILNELPRSYAPPAIAGDASGMRGPCKGNPQRRAARCSRNAA